MAEQLTAVQEELLDLIARYRQHEARIKRITEMRGDAIHHGTHIELVGDDTVSRWLVTSRDRDELVRIRGRIACCLETIEATDQVAIFTVPEFRRRFGITN